MAAGTSGRNTHRSAVNTEKTVDIILHHSSRSVLPFLTEAVPLFNKLDCFCNLLGQFQLLPMLINVLNNEHPEKSL